MVVTDGEIRTCCVRIEGRVDNRCSIGEARGLDCAALKVTLVRGIQGFSCKKRSASGDTVVCRQLTEKNQGSSIRLATTRGGGVTPVSQSVSIEIDNNCCT